MQGNKIRRNPFVVAPALAFVLLLVIGIAGRFPIASIGSVGAYAVLMLLMLVGYGIPTVAFFAIRGSGALRASFRPITKRSLSVSFAVAFTLIVQSVLLRAGICRASYDYRTYTVFGGAFETQADSFGSFLLIILSLCIFPVLLEGLFFRGILMHEYRHGGFFLSAFFSSLLYAMTAMTFSAQPFLAFLDGFLLALCGYLTGNLVCSMLSHGIYLIFALFAERYFYFIADESETRVLFFLIFGSFYLLFLYRLFHTSELLFRERGEREEALPPRIPKKKALLVIYDMVTALFFSADILCFVLFAVLNLLL